jgi:hypothetical protein
MDFVYPDLLVLFLAQEFIIGVVSVKTAEPQRLVPPPVIVAIGVISIPISITVI